MKVMPRKWLKTGDVKTKSTLTTRSRDRCLGEKISFVVFITERSIMQEIAIYSAQCINN